jgi:hypothetical protein
MLLVGDLTVLTASTNVRAIATLDLPLDISRSTSSSGRLSRSLPGSSSGCVGQARRNACPSPQCQLLSSLLVHQQRHPEVRQRTSARARERERAILVLVCVLGMLGLLGTTIALVGSTCRLPRNSAPVPG